MISIEENDLTRGYAYDYYSVESRPEGTSGRFDTTRTWAGSMVYQLKYAGISITEKEELYSQIESKIAPELLAANCDKPLAVLPAPSYLTDLSKNFHKVPYRLAKSIAEILEVRWYPYFLVKNVDVESKTAKAGEEWDANAFTHPRQFQYPTNVLIVDDTYGEGRTLRACIRALRQDPNVNEIYFFSLARNRAGGLKS